MTNECTHEFRPFDSTGRVACVYCNTRGCQHGGDPRTCSWCDFLKRYDAARPRRYDVNGRELESTEPDSKWYWVRYDDVRDLLGDAPAECQQRDVREAVPAVSLPPELKDAAERFGAAFGRHVHQFEGEPIGLCSCGARLVPKDWSIAIEMSTGQPVCAFCRPGPCNCAKGPHP